MAGPDRDRWYDAAAIELARRVGDRYTITSWGDGVWERARAAGFSSAEAVEMLLRHPPTANDAARRSGPMPTPTP